MWKPGKDVKFHVEGRGDYSATSKAAELMVEGIAAWGGFKAGDRQRYLLVGKGAQGHPTVYGLPGVIRRDGETPVMFPDYARPPAIKKEDSLHLSIRMRIVSERLHGNTIFHLGEVMDALGYGLPPAKSIKYDEIGCDGPVEVGRPLSEHPPRTNSMRARCATHPVFLYTGRVKDDGWVRRLDTLLAGMQLEEFLGSWDIDPGKKPSG